MVDVVGDDSSSSSDDMKANDDDSSSSSDDMKADSRERGGEDSDDDTDDMNMVDMMLSVFNGSEKTVNHHGILEPALLVLTGAVMVWLLTTLLMKCRNKKANSEYTALADSRV